MDYRYLCIVEYDGTNYHGWQKQENAITVQETIEQALKSLFLVEVPIHGASRTDTGVHARYQQFHMDLNKQMEPDKLKLAINHFLPEDILIKEVTEIDPSIHARHQVTKKEYIYKVRTYKSALELNRSAYVYQELDFDLMQEAIQVIIGEHDFLSFTSDQEYHSTVRTIYEAEMTIDGGDITFRFLGNGFMRYMIRILVGTIIEIGMGKKQNMQAILDAKSREAAGKSMPPEGLYLNHIWMD